MCGQFVVVSETRVLMSEAFEACFVLSLREVVARCVCQKKRSSTADAAGNSSEDGDAHMSIDTFPQTSENVPLLEQLSLLRICSRV
jgi:hypothetical protein